MASHASAWVCVKLEDFVRNLVLSCHNGFLLDHKYLLTEYILFELDRITLNDATLFLII